MYVNVYGSVLKRKKQAADTLEKKEKLLVAHLFQFRGK